MINCSVCNVGQVSEPPGRPVGRLGYSVKPSLLLIFLSVDYLFILVIAKIKPDVIPEKLQAISSLLFHPASACTLAIALILFLASTAKKTLYCNHCGSRVP